MADLNASKWKSPVPGLICAGLTIITLLVFAQTFTFEALNFDDDLVITENPHLAAGLSRTGFSWAFTANLTHHDPNVEYWEPLTLISRLADVQFSGMNAGAHHRTSVFLHLAAGLMLFGALRALLRSDVKAGVIAALFLIHPLHVEPVAWLAARKDVLNGLFFFATIWAYVLYARQPGWRRFALVCFAFVCANLAKPMGVSLPFVLLLLDFWPLGRWRAPFFSRAAFRLLLEKLPLIAIAAAVAVLAMRDQQQQGAVGDDALYPLPIRLGNAAISYCAYLGQTILPFDLAIFYPHPGTALNVGTALASAAFLALVTLGCILQANRRPWLLVGWLWFGIVLLPVAGIVQIGEMSRADRYTYVSLVGLFLASVHQLSISLTTRIRNSPRPTAWRVSIGSGVAILVAALAATAWSQTSTWRNSVSVFQRAIDVTDDNYVAQANLGSALFAAGDRDAGLAHYQEAVRLHAPALAFHRQTAIAAEEAHDLPRAIQHYGKFLTLVPCDADVHQRLGGVLFESGDYARALVQYNEALRYNREAIPPRLGVARVLMAQQRTAEARGLLQRILEMDSSNEEALQLLRRLPQ
ncbi:MAG: tetratricopeptide repeat protein [Chthoniobacterales bacterium]